MAILLCRAGRKTSAQSCDVNEIVVQPGNEIMPIPNTACRLGGEAPARSAAVRRLNDERSRWTQYLRRCGPNCATRVISHVLSVRRQRNLTSADKVRTSVGGRRRQLHSRGADVSHLYVALVRPPADAPHSTAVVTLVRQFAGSYTARK